MKEDDYVRLELFLEGMERIKDAFDGIEAWMNTIEERLTALENKNENTEQ